MDINIFVLYVICSLCNLVYSNNNINNTSYDNYNNTIYQNNKLFKSKKTFTDYIELISKYNEISYYNNYYQFYYNITKQSKYLELDKDDYNLFIFNKLKYLNEEYNKNFTNNIFEFNSNLIISSKLNISYISDIVFYLKKHNAFKFKSFESDKAIELFKLVIYIKSYIMYYSFNNYCIQDIVYNSFNKTENNEINKYYCNYYFGIDINKSNTILNSYLETFNRIEFKSHFESQHLYNNKFLNMIFYKIQYEFNYYIDLNGSVNFKYDDFLDNLYVFIDNYLEKHVIEYNKLSIFKLIYFNNKSSISKFLFKVLFYLIKDNSLYNVKRNEFIIFPYFDILRYTPNIINNYLKQSNDVIIELFNNKDNKEDSLVLINEVKNEFYIELIMNKYNYSSNNNTFNKLNYNNLILKNSLSRYSFVNNIKLNYSINELKNKFNFYYNTSLMSYSKLGKSTEAKLLNNFNIFNTYKLNINKNINNFFIYNINFNFISNGVEINKQFLINFTKNKLELTKLHDFMADIYNTSSNKIANYKISSKYYLFILKTLNFYVETNLINEFKKNLIDVYYLKKKINFIDSLNTVNYITDNSYKTFYNKNSFQYNLILMLKEKELIINKLEFKMSDFFYKMLVQLKINLLKNEIVNLKKLYLK